MEQRLPAYTSRAVLGAPSEHTTAPSLEVVQGRGRRPGTARLVVLAFDGVVAGLAAAILQTPAAFVYAALVVVGCLVAAKAHKRFAPRASDDVPAVVVTSALPIAVTPLIGSAADVEAIVIAVPFVVVGLLLGRLCAYAVIRRLRTAAHRRRRVIIVGGRGTSRDLLDALRGNRKLGVDVVCYVGEPTDLPLEWAGPVTVLPRIAAVRGVDHVIVGDDDEIDRDVIRAIRECAAFGVGASVVPRLFRVGAVPPSTWVDWVWKTPLIHIPPPPQRTYSWSAKRFMDVALAGTALIVLSPLLAIVAATVAATSRGPVLFRQQRVTEGGQPFEILKFRTLPMNDGSDVRWSHTELEPTRVGVVLRRTGIDELPQLINIVKGEMSLVGPRPERPYFVQEFSQRIAGYDERLRVPAGLTGWAQVNGLRGADTSMQDRVDFDNQYIEGWSLWHDVVILARTAKAFVAGQGR